MLLYQCVCAFVCVCVTVRVILCVRTCVCACASSTEKLGSLNDIFLHHDFWFNLATQWCVFNPTGAIAFGVWIPSQCRSANLSRLIDNNISTQAVASPSCQKSCSWASPPLLKERSTMGCAQAPHYVRVSLVVLLELTRSSRARLVCFVWCRCMCFCVPRRMKIWYRHPHAVCVQHQGTSSYRSCLVYMLCLFSWKHHDAVSTSQAFHLYFGTVSWITSHWLGFQNPRKKKICSLHDQVLHVHIYICTYIYIYIYIHIYISMYICVWVSMNKHTSIANITPHLFLCVCRFVLKKPRMWKIEART